MIFRTASTVFNLLNFIKIVKRNIHRYTYIYLIDSAKIEQSLFLFRFSTEVLRRKKKKIKKPS